MYYFDTDGFERERLYHSCYRGERQLCPSTEEVERTRVYEDGYFRGVVAGRRHSGFRNSPLAYNVIKCKACGEEYTW